MSSSQTRLAFKDIKESTTLRLSNAHKFVPYQTAANNNIDEDIGVVVASLFDRSIIQTEPQLFASLVNANGNGIGTTRNNPTM